MDKAKELAKKLDGFEYGDDFNEEYINFAKENGLVIVTGYSDDGCVFSGAIDDEIGCFDGGEAYFDGTKLITDIDDFSQKELDSFVCLNIYWCEVGQPFSWSYKFNRNIPVEKFYVFDGGEDYCEGIVFKLSDLLNKQGGVVNGN